MPRYGDEDSIRWFEVKPNCTFHIINCFEDGDEVVVWGSRALASVIPRPQPGSKQFEWFPAKFKPVSLIGGKPVTGRQPSAAVILTAGHRIRWGDGFIAITGVVIGSGNRLPFEAEASIAMEICGPDSSIANFICAAQMAKATDTFLLVKDGKPLCNDPNYKPSSSFNSNDRFWGSYRIRSDNSKNTSRRCYEHIHFPIAMIGSAKPDQITQRTLPEDAIGHIHLSKFNDWFYQTRSDNSKNTSRRCYEHIHFPTSMIGFTKPDQITQRTLPEDVMSIFIFQLQ
ncbi:hypothetical protein F3Y22_tig00013738pilonHSYRG00031 [Hibiscus syriacus]|uniref:Uncharacterized protein n=1 Tax=Hibiscus syriacus TaxID=106335 RepID=A0A6A3C160_HIBSY|nr:hypothetical protein F3Y22_tig00013738pilonHSYRG00031 [Hibiscus syriacus]